MLCGFRSATATPGVAGGECYSSRCSWTWTADAGTARPIAASRGSAPAATASSSDAPAHDDEHPGPARPRSSAAGHDPGYVEAVRSSSRTCFSPSQPGVCGDRTSSAPTSARASAAPLGERHRHRLRPEPLQRRLTSPPPSSAHPGRERRPGRGIAPKATASRGNQRFAGRARCPTIVMRTPRFPEGPVWLGRVASPSPDSRTVRLALGGRQNFDASPSPAAARTVRRSGPTARSSRNGGVSLEHEGRWIAKETRSQAASNA